MKKPFKYYKKEYDWCIIYSCDTDFSKYSYVPDITLYRKGCFRDKEKEVVIKIRNIMIPENQRDKFYYFKNQKEGIKFINKFIKELK